MTTSIIFFLVIAGLIAAWVCYMLIKSHDVLKDMEETNAPYKVEPPKSTEHLAVSAPDKPVRDLNELLKNWGSLEELNPKRKYTKRSKYWTDKRKKAAARKAKKKTSKSK